MEEQSKYEDICPCTMKKKNQFCIKDEIFLYTECHEEKHKGHNILKIKNKF